MLMKSQDPGSKTFGGATVHPYHSKLDEQRRFRQPSQDYQVCRHAFAKSNRSDRGPDFSIPREVKLLLRSQTHEILFL